ncbi:MAG: peptidylprolyl isomerase [Chloroflexi bacterium]|nr:peptidylprolyl isomerase [Chloroflexota bacterium]
MPTATRTPSPTPTSTPGAADLTATPNHSEEARVAQDGSTVDVHYTGTLDNGEQFDSSIGSEPLTFVVGSGQVIKGFDEAVRGMTIGDKKTFRIEAEEAYGPRQEDLVFDIPKASAPADLETGDYVRFSNGASAVVVEVTTDHIKVDANHPLAGQALTFAIELVAVR